MDILLFREQSAKESLEFAQSQGWRFYRSLSRYAASFYSDPEHAEAIVLQVFANHQPTCGWEEIDSTILRDQKVG